MVELLIKSTWKSLPQKWTSSVCPHIHTHTHTHWKIIIIIIIISSDSNEQSMSISMIRDTTKKSTLRVRRDHKNGGRYQPQEPGHDGCFFVNPGSGGWITPSTKEQGVPLPRVIPGHTLKAWLDTAWVSTVWKRTSWYRERRGKTAAEEYRIPRWKALRDDWDDRATGMWLPLRQKILIVYVPLSEFLQVPSCRDNRLSSGWSDSVDIQAPNTRCNLRGHIFFSANALNLLKFI